MIQHGEIKGDWVSQKKNPIFLKKIIGSGGRTVCSRRLSFCQFVVLMSMTNCEKDSLLGQTVLPPEPSQFLEKDFFAPPFSWVNEQQGPC